MEDTWTRRGTAFMIVMSILLQIAAIASPGWIIDVKGNFEVRDSIFYRQECTTLLDTECEAESFKDIYSASIQIIKRAGMAQKGIANLELEYNQLIMKQVFVVVSFFVTLMVLLAHLCRVCHVDRHYHRLITHSAVLAALPLGLMISIICGDLVYISYKIDTRSYDTDRDHTYIGFPYSIALYIAAVVFQSLAVYILMGQSAGPAKERPIVKKRPADYESDNYGGRPVVKAEFIPVTETTTTDIYKAPKEVEPISTICYSEKL